jgi:2-hydroxychromene-2-carboxylate isomerase
VHLTFYFDVVCPFAYLASTQVEALAAKAGITLEWKPVLLGGLFKLLDSPSRPADAWPVGKREHNHRDLARQAELLGVPLSPPPEHPRRTVAAMRLLVAADESTRAPLAHRLFEAYWQRGEDISDRTVLDRYAAEAGLDPACVEDPTVKDALRQRTQAAFDLGIFGVPTLAVGDEWWWGVDHMSQVSTALGLEPTPQEPPAKTGRRLRFFHDFSSPFAFLASQQVERIAEQHGATLEYVPILLGALFQEISTPMIPLFEMSASRRNWMSKDLHGWAKWWEVPFRFASTFPLRTVAPLRVSLQDPATVNCMYRAAWQDDLNIGEPEVLVDVLNASGFDGEALLEGTQAPEIKMRLRENTALAAGLGVCGVPTFQVDDGPLFWGQDRLFMVERALQGWVPKIDEERGPVGAFL